MGTGRPAAAGAPRGGRWGRAAAPAPAAGQPCGPGASDRTGMGGTSGRRLRSSRAQRTGAHGRIQPGVPGAGSHCHRLHTFPSLRAEWTPHAGQWSWETWFVGDELRVSRLTWWPRKHGACPQWTWRRRVPGDVEGWPPAVRLRLPWFQVPEVSRGPKIVNGKFQK